MSETYSTHVETVRRRWPVIGRYADHPVGEWLYDRMQERPWRRRYRGRYTSDLVLFIILFMFLNIFGILLFLLIKPLLAPNRKKKDMAQPASYLNGRRSAILPELWLSGISYHELASIESTLAVADPWNKALWWVGLVLWNLIAAIVVYTLLQFHSSINALAWTMAGSGIVFWFILYFAINNANTEVRKALGGLLLDAQERHLGRFKQYFTKTPKFILIVFVAFCVIRFLGRFQWNASYALHCGIALFTIGIIYLPFHISRIQPRLVQKLFLESSAKGQMHFAGIINAESEQDLPRHRK